MDCIATAYAISKCYSSQTVEWNDFIEELKRRESLEKARAEARERARNRANEECVHYWEIPTFFFDFPMSLMLIFVHRFV